jgi:hypothetical protein
VGHSLEPRSCQARAVGCSRLQEARSYPARAVGHNSRLVMVGVGKSTFLTR